MAKKNRRCGSCSACCEVLPIEEVDSPRYTACKHQRGSYNCCSIYPDRPSFCSKFKCAWLHGNFSIADRPNKIGCFVTSDRSSDFGDFLSFREIYPSSLHSHRVNTLINRCLKKKINIVLIYVNGEREARGSEEFLKGIRSVIDNSVLIENSYPKHL
jgi:hypothetical protein